ncbi:MAG TPA: hypothetical protein VLL52_12705 [Anaerolineae bacterium]|nr:hypothetical protein [Anaerolineae bacterium]
MSDAEKKLREDLNIITAMAADMDQYLTSDVLFWPLDNSQYPRLTLGGYLFRQHRLQALTHLLSSTDQNQLTDTTAQFHNSIDDRIVRVEERAHQELETRLRQWQTSLQEMRQNADNTAYYATAAEKRAMMDAIIDHLSHSPYRLDQDLANRLNQLDITLRSRWRDGDFIWPDEWQDAYPKSQYWWLYGAPV